MKTRHSRWMTWVLEEAARETPPPPFARGKQRAATIARRTASESFPPLRTSAPQQDHARG